MPQEAKNDLRKDKKDKLEEYKKFLESKIKKEKTKIIRKWRLHPEILREMLTEKANRIFNQGEDITSEEDVVNTKICNLINKYDNYSNEEKGMQELYWMVHDYLENEGNEKYDLNEFYCFVNNYLQTKGEEKIEDITLEEIDNKIEQLNSDIIKCKREIIDNDEERLQQKK